MTLQSKIKKYIPNFLLPVARKYCPNNIRNIYKYHKGNGFETELSILIKHGPIGIPYNWAVKQNVESINVLRDETLKLPYVQYGEYKIYYPATMSEEEIKDMYNNVVNIEQDIRSPHRYLTESFSIEKDDIVVDCGASEGFFSIEHINIIKKLYLFEPDIQWIEPLTATYSQWIDKIEIVTKFLSDNTDEVSTTLDDYFKDKESPSFIKMDVEGFEERILDGGNKTLSSPHLKKVVSCVYHHANDEEILSKKLGEYGFKISPSDGYTILSLDVEEGKLQPPYFRHGVIRCQK